MNDQTEARPHRRVLLCNIGRVGDTIIRNTILDSVRKSFAHVGYICGRATAALLATEERIDSLYVFSNTPSGIRNLFRAIIRGRHDCLIDLKDHGSRTSQLIATFCRARLKIGCNRRHFRPFQRDLEATARHLRNKYEVMKRIASVCGLADGDFRPRLTCSHDARIWFKSGYDDRRGFVFVNLSATVESRMWPVAHWKSLLAHKTLSHLRFLVNGLPQHAPLVREIVESTPNAVAFEPRDVMDVVAAVERSIGVVTVDTGVTQMGAALSKPLIVLYASTEECAEYHPGGECNIFLTPPLNHRLDTMTPSHVLTAFHAAAFASVPVSVEAT